MNEKSTRLSSTDCEFYFFLSRFICFTSRNHIVEIHKYIAPRLYRVEPSIKILIAIERISLTYVIRAIIYKQLFALFDRARNHDPCIRAKAKKNLLVTYINSDEQFRSAVYYSMVIAIGKYSRCEITTPVPW